MNVGWCRVRAEKFLHKIYGKETWWSTLPVDLCGVITRARRGI